MSASARAPALAEEALGDLVHGAVVLRDDVGISADDELGDIHSAGTQRIELLEQHLDVDDDAVRDDRNDSLGQDAARQQVQRILLVADDDRVTGVVATVELHDVVDATAKKVGGLALAFVSPLGADDDDSWHGLSP